ncbi:MAG: trifunctional transcriptional regulator/proline dehydrogenase/L-glutamate gamma-semialdehyde [Pseudomonadota bacterium]|jgi:RHH-type proline utilization regulon transcriptional repressor/proline dehydrogenase/delta 1-pyrroline-5-carboxylate dehydrogenase
MFDFQLHQQSELKNTITQHYRATERECVNKLLSSLSLNNHDETLIAELASDLITQVRDNRIKGNGVDALMQEFKLSTQEGIALMCLAESLLRIPDTYTKNKLIQDKLKTGDWRSHTQSDNFFVNASSWGLLLTGKLVNSEDSNKLTGYLIKTIGKWGEPLIRKAMATAVRFMGNQFVMGETIDEALKAAKQPEQQGYQFSYDMLGEAALTAHDADKYMHSYIQAIHQVGKENAGRGTKNGPGISVKLSAIHPRYSRLQRERVADELFDRLKQLYLLAKDYQIAIFIDAEESERLELSLDLLERIVAEPELAGFTGIGFVIQAYQRRAPYVIDYVVDLAKRYQQRLMIRLVKGAYWDSEIKRAQVDGQTDYPVFTRKFYTDLSYLVCAQKLLNAPQQIYPAFATHNAYSLAAIYTMAKKQANCEFEFQCLYGMGETLYNNVVGVAPFNLSCRVYAPVGTHETLLAYLVRRLLENGANSSFVHQLVDPDIPISELVISPIALARKVAGLSNPFFNLPPQLYAAQRLNSRGLDLSDELQLNQLETELNHFAQQYYLASSLLATPTTNQQSTSKVINPANMNDIVGEVYYANNLDIDPAVANALIGFKSWSTLNPQQRTAKILLFADLLEQNYSELLALIMREAGKTLSNAIAEIREAVDFCRYYASVVIEDQFDNSTHPALGCMVCISPWNFPLAIFVGEVISSLVVGNSVIAKPAIQTNLIAHYAVKLMHQAGIPQNIVQLILGDGSNIGNLLTQHQQIAGVIFTGSTEVAQIINQNLAQKNYSSVLIAETGGQNAMIVDSTALPEQVVQDVINSAFDSAGQRCSALRVLYLQSDIANKIIEMLKGAMAQLRVGNPCLLKTDIGPVIDQKAQQILLTHIDKFKRQARQHYQTPLTTECSEGIFIPPTFFEIGSIKELNREIFGPIVHIIRFSGKELDQVIEEINSSGYGLTQGLHSRLEETARKVYQKVKAGNIYINRNTVGAVVGVQPFGGEGLSGTGPKAGGALYLYRLTANQNWPHLATNQVTVDFSLLTHWQQNLTQLALSQTQIEHLNQLINQLQHNSPLTSQVELVGPTGERNFMVFAPRGIVGLFATNLYDYCIQISYALATQNQIVLNDDNLTRKLANCLPSKASQYLGDILQAPLLHAVLVSQDYPEVQSLRCALAKRNSLLTQVLVANHANYYNSHLLLTERSISINVTATGGNVHLMSINDKITL